MNRITTVLAVTIFASACQASVVSSAEQLTPAASASASQNSMAPVQSPARTFDAARYMRMSPDVLRITNSSLVASNRVSPMDVTVNDARLATDLLRIAAQLQPGAPISFCPLDYGFIYTIEWKQAGRTVVVGRLQAQACRRLQLDDGPSLVTTPTFWSALAATVGVPEPQLHPTPLP